MKVFLSIFLFLLLLPAAQAEQARLAVAANFLATAKALVGVFEKQTGHELLVSAASTGKLYAQIINDAPYDVFLSADRHHPQLLETAGRVVEGSRFVYATGRLVLWSSEVILLDEASLTKGEFKRLAMANPRTAPYGRAAQLVLKNMGLWQRVKAKLVRGESIAQAFQFVATGNAQLGLVALSQVLNPANAHNRQGYWLIPEDQYEPLQQAAVLLQQGQDNIAAKQFLQFLHSDKAIMIMNRYGYG
ncbi:MAG TPA: molybdate ABC transporter substrate-binding protein [Candidatus Tenderia electrophaga]|uniref:Molybdate ABC transporter substrate-binding protein n=1 Tax=Candidatus Tenderia electrophaga TaxID=1748243 RepID=A0A832N5Y8_9GAMM|nr:molybdate ABC transporter substrate-binding protein [Candidatus Tenderia electrophaga]